MPEGSSVRAGPVERVVGPQQLPGDFDGNFEANLCVRFLNCGTVSIAAQRSGSGAPEILMDALICLLPPLRSIS
jgi:hypothetical protein